MKTHLMGQARVRERNGLYCLNDLHRASGVARRNPADFLRVARTRHQIDLLRAGDMSRAPYRRVRGAGLMACRDLALAYARWLSEDFYRRIAPVFPGGPLGTPPPDPGGIARSGDLFSLTDIYRAGGSVPGKKPHKWLRLAGQRPRTGAVRVITAGGRMGTYAPRELALAYAGWISGEMRRWAEARMGEGETPGGAGGETLPLENEPALGPGDTIETDTADSSSSPVIPPISKKQEVLSLGEFAIRQTDGLYSLNDLHRAAGGESRHQPALFLRLDTTKSLAAEICSTDSQIKAIEIIRGRGKVQGTYACRELVIAKEGAGC